jgi:hypothetical protein
VKLTALAGAERFEVEVALELDRLLSDPRCERELELALHRGGLPELRDEFGERQLDRL